ncbi:MAG: hypothetical protein DRN15_06335 [Thermoprotei archaeon]|nr:MAG: hypothetical protein DRN15_06335 [Thermoprotei archaeon]
MAYMISLIIALAILAHPQNLMITLREESLEKALALDYWLVVNALAYAQDKPNPEQAFIAFLEDELQALDPRIIEIPNATIESLIELVFNFFKCSPYVLRICLFPTSPRYLVS